MALLYTISACSNDNCSVVNVFDTTGLYNAIANTGGWGAPNPDISTATSSTLQVMYPGSILPVTINTYPTLPNITNTPYQLNPGGINMPNFPDGQYQFISTIVANSVTYMANTTIYLTCGVTCCVRNMIATATQDINCCTSDTQVMAAQKAQLLLAGIIANAKNGNYTAANNALAQLQIICSGSDCGCGC
jgi:hypothetical protein